VLAVLCFFGIGLPAIDDALRSSSAFDSTSVYAVSKTVSFTPAPGWVVDKAARSRTPPRFAS
jgi:hypothetical protein